MKILIVELNSSITVKEKVAFDSVANISFDDIIKPKVHYFARLSKSGAFHINGAAFPQHWFNIIKTFFE